MKKLSIEEKAKRYDEALKRARKIENGEPINVPDGTSVPVAIFPELKENEDERIRKQIISFLKEFEYDHYRCLDFSSWIAWLKKQGEHKSIWHNEDEEPQRGSLILLIMQSGTPVVAKIIEPNHTFNHGERWAYIDDLLEKQGEQKPIDKVEPKFKVGDWIIDKQGLVHQIENVVENVTSHTFGYDIVGGGYFNDNSDVLLWTIEDAKDGDVLCSLFHHLIWIYKDSGQYYACVNMNYTTENINTNGLINIPNDVRPATKDEQTILFEKMKEAGYKWNTDKKKLIKL